MGGIDLTIEEQKKYLFERLELESLCFSEQNRVDIEQFEQATSGNKIAEYKSISEAARRLGITDAAIRYALKNSSKCCNSYWIYK